MAESLTTLTRRLAEECYTLYKSDYERAHGVTLSPWNDLDHKVQARWCSALSPTATRLVEAEHLQEYLSDAQARLDRLQDADDRASERLSRLERAVIDARRALPDLAALGPLPGPLVQLVGRLGAALDDAGSAEAGPALV